MKGRFVCISSDTGTYIVSTWLVFSFHNTFHIYLVFVVISDFFTRIGKEVSFVSAFDEAVLSGTS
jgi:hypothetical protein